MRKNFLHRLNLIIGAVSISLAGCHTTKQSVQTSGNETQAFEPAPPPPPEPIPEPKPVDPPPVKYGVPWNSEWE